MMTTKTQTSSQIQPYLDVVETKLRDLPEDERVELLSDLESHLEEILADESDTALTERIGAPDAYADEFAASIGLEGEPTSSRSLAQTISGSLRRAKDHPVTERARRLSEEMRPAWWTLRGLAIGLFLSWNYLGPGDPGLLWVMQFVAGAFVIFLIGVSMRIGRNSYRNSGWRRLSVAITIAGVIVGISFMANVAARMDSNYAGDGFYRHGLLTEQDARFITTTTLSPDAPLIITP